MTRETLVYRDLSPLGRRRSPGDLTALVMYDLLLAEAEVPSFQPRVAFVEIEGEWVRVERSVG